MTDIGCCIGFSH